MSLISSWVAPSWGLVGREEVETRVWRLSRDAVLRAEAGRHGIELRCEAGMLLVTRAGDLEDHVLEPGDRIRLSRRDEGVVQALREALVSAVPLGPASGSRAARTRTTSRAGADRPLRS